MSFKGQLKRDAISTFLNTDEFSESIVYTPHNGSSKLIKAIVNRQRLLPSAEDTGRTLMNQAEIMIANNSVNGVSSVNKGEDKVSLPQRVGDINVDWIVADILDQDEAMFHLLIQR